MERSNKVRVFIGICLLILLSTWSDYGTQKQAVIENGADLFYTISEHEVVEEPDYCLKRLDSENMIMAIRGVALGGAVLVLFGYFYFSSKNKRWDVKKEDF